MLSQQDLELLLLSSLWTTCVHGLLRLLRCWIEHLSKRPYRNEKARRAMLGSSIVAVENCRQADCDLRQGEQARATNRLQCTVVFDMLPSATLNWTSRRR